MRAPITTNQSAPIRHQHQPGAKVLVGPQPLSHVRHGWRKRSNLDVKAVAEEIHAAFPSRLPKCDFMDHLRASKKTGVDLLHELVTFPGYTPEQTGMDALAAASDMLTGQALVDMQAFWVNEITKYPFARLGSAMERLIKDRGEKLVPEVWPQIIEWFKGHPRTPKGFFAQRDVLPKIPSTDAISALLTALPSRRATWLEGREIRGGRPSG